MRRPLILLATLVLLWALLAQVNHALAELRVYLFAGALYVVYAALQHSRRTGLTTAFLGGLICDATTPVVFGTHALLFAAGHTFLFRVRERVPRDDAIGLTIVTLLLNLALFLVFSFTQIHRSPAPAAVWPRLIVDLVCSQVFLTLITPWFCALQARALALARAERDFA